MGKLFTKLDVNWKFLAFVLIVVLSLIYYGRFFMQFLQDPFIGGYDSPAHYDATIYYSQHIFPQLLGWSFNWNGGNPWPIGYPPLHLYIFSIIHALSGIQIMLLYKLSLILATLAIPILIYLLARRIRFTIFQSLMAGVVTVFFMTATIDVLIPVGITAAGTFLSGVHGHLWASATFLLWLILYLSDHKYKRIISPLLIAIILLFNLIVFQIAIAAVVAINLVNFFYTKKYTPLLNILSDILVPLMLDSWWLIPLVKNVKYFPQVVHQPAEDLRTYFPTILLPLIALAIIGMWKAFKQKQLNVVQIGALVGIIFLISVFPTNYFPGLPIVPTRFFTMGYLLMAIPAVYSIQIEKLSAINIVKTLILILPFVLWFRPLPLKLNSLSFGYHLKLPTFGTVDYHKINSIVEFLADKTDGRSLVEFPSVYVDSTEQYILTSALGNTGAHQTLWNTYRQLTLNSAFTTPLRDAFSNGKDCYGVTALLCQMQEFNDNIDNLFRVADLYNIKYFVVKSDKAKAILAGRAKINFLQSFGDWSVYKYNSDPGFAYQTSQSPTLVFSEIKPNIREINSYDWLRLNEELLKNLDRGITLAQANNLDLSQTKDFQDFDTALLIGGYYYTDLDKAVDNLREFTLNGHKLMILKRSATSSELVEEVKSLPNTTIIESTGQLSDDFRLIIEKLPQAAIQLAVEIEFSDNAINLRNIQTQWVYVKNSYFPYWQGTDAHVYMATPANMLVVTKNSSIKLNFDYQHDLQLSAFIVFAAGGLLCYEVFRIKKYHAKN